VRASGGGARSALWRQILADALESEIALVNVTEGAAYGAALLAGVGAGVFASVEEACARTVHVVERVAPGPAAAVYREYYRVYQDLYPALAAQFRAVSEIAARLSR
ncbi:MAG: xylulokinase, partial [Chloroflexi bacterium]|nr:xylulokinase [Chloroflexota bacterium]